MAGIGGRGDEDKQNPAILSLGPAPAVALDEE